MADLRMALEELLGKWELDQDVDVPWGLPSDFVRGQPKKIMVVWG